MLAVGTDEVAHVLDDAERRHVQLLIHPYRPTRVGQRHLLRRRHHDRPGQRHRLAQAERHVAGAGRHVHHEVIKVAPLHFAEELLNDSMQHRTTPDDRRLILRQEAHRHDTDAVLFRRNDFLAVGGQLRLNAEHDRDVGAVNVAVDHPHSPSVGRQRDREVDRHRGLANPAFARSNGDDVLDAGKWCATRRRRHGRADIGRHLHVDSRDAR